VFGNFFRDNKQYQHCLVILSGGKIGSKDVKQIIALVLNYNNNDWPVRFVCERGDVSRPLLVAANNQQLDLRMLSDPNINKWIQVLKKPDVNDALPVDNKPQLIGKAPHIQDNNSVETEIEKGEPVRVEIKIVSTLPDGSIKFIDPNDNIDKTVTDINEVINSSEEPDGYRDLNEDSKPLRVEIVNIQPKPSADKSKDPNENIIKPEDAETKDPNSNVIKEDGLGKGADRPPVKNKSNWWIWFVTTVLVVLIILMLLIKGPFRNSSGEPFSDQIDDQEDIQQRLVCLAGQQRYELGDTATLGEVVVGNSIGSTVYINNENVEENHLRIFRSRKKVRVQNLSSSPISVDGIGLKPKKKTDLFLPSEIELADGVIVSLIEENIDSFEA